MSQLKELTEFDLAVLSHIGKKSEHPPRSGKVLKTLLGEKDTRKIRLSIIKLIEVHGDVIIGDATCGYYLAENTNDGVEACERLMKTLRSLGYHHKILQRAVFKKLSGQMMLVE